MGRLLIVGLVIIGMVLGTASAQAGGGHYKRYYHGHGGHHHGHFHGGHHRGHYRDYGDELLIGVGIVAGALLLTRLLTPPRYPYPPVYYAPPRPRTCVQDRVYRYLPDGRIQWGTRTTCY